ncbi:MAG: hypothetical protein IH594_07370 [Bacteroidales bacterium]|nr:hypothetical protein [Bacteroidales bacterium]
MKKYVFFTAMMILFLLEANDAFTQNYDLIVNLKGDSIACHIDSISGQYLYFEMKIYNDWVHTKTRLAEIDFYEYNSIHPRDYRFEAGSSVIKSVYTETLPRNSIYIGIITLSYSRIFLGNPVGIAVAAGGLYIDAAPGIWMETSLLKGKSKHYFEPGINFFYIFNTETLPGADNSLKGFGLRIGYRYQAPGGFLFRISPNVIFTEDGEIVPLPALSLGYSF